MNSVNSYSFITARPQLEEEEQNFPQFWKVMKGMNTKSQFS